MPKMMIPEIGTKFTLASDWFFDLYNEYRNTAMWERVDGSSDPNVIAHEKERSRLGSIYSSASMARHQRNENHTPEQIREIEANFSKAHAEYFAVYSVGTKTPIVIPAGSVISIDRIYIRKGSSDYSSVTFYLQSSTDPNLDPSTKVNGKKQKKLRFWTKLSDVNKIEFV